MRAFSLAIRHDLARMATDLEARARERIMEAVNAKKFTRRALGRLIGYGDTGIGLILNGKRGVPLAVLQAAAELAQVDPAEWIADPRALVKALTPFEAEVLRYAREWPPTTRTAFVTFLRYFSEQGSHEELVRRCVELVRSMPRADQHRAESYLLMLREGQLPDYRAKHGAKPARGSIDELLADVPAADVATIREMAMHAHQAARRRKRGEG